MSMDFLGAFEGDNKKEDVEEKPKEKKRKTIATPKPRPKQTIDKKPAPKGAPKQKRTYTKKPTIDEKKLSELHKKLKDDILDEILEHLKNNSLSNEQKSNLKYEFEIIYNSIKKLNKSKKVINAIEEINNILGEKK